MARRPRPYQPRYRWDCRGELIQIDGSKHWWFEDRGPQCTLLVYIDDATSELIHLKMVESESTFAYMDATKEYIETHGKPVAFYSDKHSVFRNNTASAKVDGMTHFGRAMEALNIEIICAHSPQAKGRVERANATLQDRLVIVCLQELKAPDDRFPEQAIRDAGYQAIWKGQSRWNGVAILSRVGEIHETRRSLPGDPADEQSRYIEAAVSGVLTSGLYLPNGNPRPGPKFDYKLRWFERLEEHLSDLIGLDAPVICLGDFNVMPTDLDVYAPERWREDALFAPETRAAFQRLIDQGWTDAVRALHPDETIYTFWKYWRGAFERNAGLRIDHALLNPLAARRLKAAEVDMRPRGWDKTSDHAPLCIELSDAAVGRKASKARPRSRP